MKVLESRDPEDGQTAELLGGSRLVIGGIVSLLVWVMPAAILIITLLINNHEPPSTRKIQLNASRLQLCL